MSPLVVARRRYVRIQPPEAPTSLTVSSVSSTSDSFDLAWTNNDADNTDTIRVERRVSGGSWGTLETLAGDATSHTDTTANQNTSYDYRVRAENDAGESSYATNSNNETRPPTPGSFSVSSSGATSNNFDLSWDDGGANVSITRYRIQRRVSGGSYSTLETTSSTSFTDTTTSGDTEYDYRIRAENGSGNSSYDASTGHPTRPDAPSGGNVTALDEQSIEVTWTVNSSLSHRQRLQYKRTSDGSWTTESGIISSGTTSRTIDGLDAETEYEARIRAENTDNNKRSAYHNCGSATTESSGPTTTVPEDFSASQNNGACPSEEVDLTWSNGDRSESKVVEWHDGDNNWTEIGTPGSSATSFTHTSPTSTSGGGAGHDNFYRIRFDTETEWAEDTANVEDCPE